MNPKFKKSQLIILGLTSLVFSRLIFFFFDDPEGPNLLVVAIGAVSLYLPSLLAYSFLKLSSSNKFLIAVLIQILIATGLCIVLK